MFVFLDIETTGFDGKKDELLEIAAIKWDGEKECGRFETLLQLPHDFEIPSLITSLTGINTQMCEESGIPIEKAIQNLSAFLSPEDTIVGHNISFDIGFLNDKGAVISNRMMDTFLISLLVLGQSETSHSLEMLAQKYGMIQENAHRAMSDCEANIQLYSFLHTKWHAQKDEVFSKWIEVMAPKMDFPEYEFFNTSPKNLFTPAQEEKNINITPLSIIGENFPEHISYTSSYPIFWECSSAEKTLSSLLLNAQKQKEALWIAYPLDEMETAVETFQAIRKAFPTLSCEFFGNPTQQIDDKKWNVFLKQPSFDRGETIVMTKVFRAKQERTEHSLRFFAEEWKAVRKIFSDEKAVPESDAACVFIPFSETYHTPHSAKLAVMRGENLETMLEEKERIKIFQKRIQEDIPEFATDIFTHLSSALRAIKGENKYTLPVYEHEFRFEKEILESIEQIKKLVEKENSWAMWQWKHFFEQKKSEDFIFCIELFPDNALSFSLIPKTLQDSFDELNACGTGVIIIGKSFPKDAQKNLRFTFPVPDESVIIPYASSYPPISYECSEALITAFLKNGNTVVMTVSSKKAGEEYGNAFRLFCEEHAIFMVAQKGGSVRKIRAQMKNQSPCFIVGTPSFLDNLRLEDIENAVVIIPKLSFDPPNHTILKFRRETLHNDFEDFALPRASQRLHRDMRRIAHAQKIIIGDPKMQQAWAKKMIL